jgi:hypothetical protein
VLAKHIAAGAPEDLDDSAVELDHQGAQDDLIHAFCRHVKDTFPRQEVVQRGR